MECHAKSLLTVEMQRVRRTIFRPNFLRTSTQFTELYFIIVISHRIIGNLLREIGVDARI